MACSCRIFYYDSTFFAHIHLGNGIFLEQEKWAWLLLRPRDRLFCKEATKLLWGVSALHNRSITGAPCRRYVRSENQAPPRRALTPKKLEAVGRKCFILIPNCFIFLLIFTDAFSKYIAGRPSEVAPIERLRKMNSFIAEMLNDLNK
nr:BEN domain-containing protein 5-like [Rhipicephalus microplus]